MKQLSWRWRLAFLAGLALLVYFPALRAGYIWDDDDYVTNNVLLRSLHGLWEIWFQPRHLVQYYPLTFTSFWINYHLGGLNPAGYHLVNVLLHAMNAFAAWALLKRLKVPGAWLAALLFLVHPVHVESVAWITERKNVLSGLFYLTAFLAYLQFKDGVPKRRPWYFLSLALFLMALLSKTVAVTFPAAVVLALWWRDGKFPAKDVLPLVPFLAAGAALGSVTVRFENSLMSGLGLPEWSFSFPARILIAGRALWFYLGKLAWPHPLIFIYPRWEIAPAALWPWAFPASFLLVLAVSWAFRSRWGRGPFAFLSIFAVTLLPALGFRDFYPMRYSFVADHFQYLASLAPLAFAGAVTVSALKDLPKLRTFLIVTALTALAFLSWKQCGAYKDLEALWRDTLSKNPGAWLAHNNLGAVLQQQGHGEEAERHYQEAIRLKPDYGLAYNNWGFLKEKEGAPEQALAHYRRAIALEPYTGEFPFYLGSLLHGLGRIDEAVPYYRKASELLPSFAAPCYNLGRIYEIKREPDPAIRWYREAMDRDPDLFQAYIALAALYEKLGRTAEAVATYEKLLERDPGHAIAHNNLANILSLRGDFAAAGPHYRRAIRLEPANILFRNNFAASLAHQGRTAEADEQYQEILRLDPGNAEARNDTSRVRA